jgi:hypothetical protein
MPNRGIPYRYALATVVGVTVFLSACVPVGGDVQTSTTRDTVPPGVGPQGTPKRVEAAFNQLRPVAGFTTEPDLTAADRALSAAILRFVPSTLVAGEFQSVAIAPDGTRVTVVSIIPPTGIRGYPLLTDLFANEASGGTPNIAPSPNDVVEVTLPDGTTVHMWGEGDGIVITASAKPDVSRTYLEAMADGDRPNGTWTTGACLELDQSDPGGFGTLPWAPFPRDLVVSCDEPHHAEVLFADVTGVDADAYDAAAISYDRNYVCDKKYNEVIGDQAGTTPSLITYAPDADEWDRGDRYLACVVTIPDAAGDEELITGRIADRTDLAYEPAVADCTMSSFKVLTRCSRPHVFQFVGSVDVQPTEYPTNSSDFDASCEPLRDTLAVETSDPVRLIAQDIGPWSFEQGVRTTRCFAGVSTGDAFATVTGSFFGRWTVLSGEGLPAGYGSPWTDHPIIRCPPAGCDGVRWA